MTQLVFTLHRFYHLQFVNANSFFSYKSKTEFFLSLSALTAQAGTPTEDRGHVIEGFFSGHLNVLVISSEHFTVCWKTNVD